MDNRYYLDNLNEAVARLRLLGEAEMDPNAAVTQYVRDDRLRRQAETSGNTSAALRYQKGLNTLTTKFPGIYKHSTFISHAAAMNKLNARSIPGRR